jgi:negative regulator of flagellin synthesis FlgM
MPEKITGQGFRPASAGSARETVRPTHAPAPETAAGGARPGTRDTVEIGSAELISRLDEALKAAPAVDSARVQAVRDAIASGTYEVDADVIAAKLIRLERELGD